MAPRRLRHNHLPTEVQLWPSQRQCPGCGWWWMPSGFPSTRTGRPARRCRNCRDGLRTDVRPVAGLRAETRARN